MRNEEKKVNRFIMIPKIIHLCWLSGDPYPPKIQKCLESWKKFLPEYEVMLWDGNRFDLNSSSWVAQAFAAKKYAFAADYIRMYALYHYGGIYLDSDVEVLKSFDELLTLPYFVGAENAGTIEAAIIGAESGCDWVKACLDYYENRDFIQENGQMDIRMLPEIMNETIGKLKPICNLPSGTTLGELKKIGKHEMTEKVYVLPCEYFSPKIFDSRQVVLTPLTYAIHHYQNSWFSHKAIVYYRTRTLMIRIFGYRLVRNIERFLRRK